MSDQVLVIYGASDDCVEFEGYIEEEYYTDSNGEFSADLVSPDGKILGVSLRFGRRGWEISTAAWTGVGGRPDWPLRFGDRPDMPEDPALVVTVPEGTTLNVVNSGYDDE